MGIFAKRSVEPQISRVGVVHDCLEIAGDNDLEHITEEAHAASKPAITSSRIWR
jgi:hypothetical protein